MTDWNQKNKILITCPKGLPPYLKAELTQLGFSITGEGVAHVETQGSLNDTLKLNLWLRTGHQVFWHVASFRAHDPERLYRELHRLPWEEFIEARGYLSIHSSVETESINDTRFANLKTKDAIVDRLKAQTGERPDSGPEKEKGAVVYLYWKEEQASIYLDTSGESLAKRGYRRNPFKAPLQETLAAALIQATGWKDEEPLVNPMCGSGTLAIEAVWIAQNRAPGLLRNRGAFMHIRDFPRTTWEELRREAREALRPWQGKILASDYHAEAIKAAQANARGAGVETLIEWRTCSFEQTPLPPSPGVLILNPEYGERLGTQHELVPIYAGIGDYFKQKGSGYRGYVLTGNLELAKHLGLKARRRLIFFNSQIECRLLEYELYTGIRRKLEEHSPSPGEK